MKTKTAFKESPVFFSVLKTFVYDPLVEWTERRHRDTAATAAKEEVRRILLTAKLN